MRHSVTEIELRNGAKGLLIDVPGASVTTYELNFRAGEYLVPRKKWETPHILEHVVSAGANEEYPDRHIFNAEMSKNGAEINAYTSYYSVAYVGEIADFEWDRVLRLQSLSLAKPLFLQAEFDAEYGNIHDELVALSNNHFRELSQTMSKSFGLRAVTDKERSELMENVNRDDLIEHYKKTHYTRNMRFIIAGSLRGRRVEVKRLLEEMELPKGSARHGLPNDSAKKHAKAVFIPNETVPNIYLLVNSHYNSIVGTKEDDALDIARIMMTDTLYSKIFGQARDKGLVYHVGSGHHLASRLTEWFLNTQVLPENALALCEIILTETRKMQNGMVDDAELETAKQYALGTFQRSMQTVGSVAGAYHRYFFDGYVEDMRTIPARIKNINKNDVTNAVRLMFSEGVGGIGVLGGTDNQLVDKLHAELQPLWHV